MKHRDLSTRDGPTDLAPPIWHHRSGTTDLAPPIWHHRGSNAALASGLFFPHRIKLRLDGTDYLPAVLKRIVYIGGTTTSFPLAAKAFTLLTDLTVSSRTINNKTIAIGGELFWAMVCPTTGRSSGTTMRRLRRCWTLST